MAIIKGVKAADVSQVTPYEENIDKLAAGIMAREDRANEMRNMIAENRAAMLKDTRDHTEDMEKAQQLEQGFKNDVDAMINQAGQDYSSISKDSIQALAMDYAGKTDFRVLTEAKRNQDEALKQRQAIESKGGVPIKFGPADPIKDSAWNQDGTINHFSNRWSYEEALDHTGAAKSLFDEIGYTLESKGFYNDPAAKEFLGKKKLDDGTYTNDWVAYWNHLKTTRSDNFKQVDFIIRNALDGFAAGGEKGAGRQYYKIHFEDAKYKQGKSDAEADAYARQKVQDLITTFGESEKTVDVTENQTRQIIGHNTDQGVNPSSVSKGKGGAEPPAKIPVAQSSATISVEGTPGEKEDDVMQYYGSLTSKDVSIPDLAKSVNTSDANYIQDSKNPYTTVSIATMVENPDDVSGDKNGQAGGKGYYYNIESANGVGPKENKTALKVKHDNSNKYTNTNASNYANYSVSGNDRLSVIIDDKGTTQLMDVDDLVENLGDDLFSYQDLQSVMKNYNNTDDANLKYLRTSMNQGKGGDKHLSTLMVTPTGQNAGNTSISPVLYDLEKLYDAKLAKSNLTPAERILYEAKSKKIKSKIEDAKNFMDSNRGALEVVKQQVLLNNEHNKMFETNIRLTGQKAGLTKEFVDAFLGQSNDGKNLDYTTKVNTAKKDAYKKSWLYQPIIDEYRPTRLVNNYNPFSPEDNLKYTNQLKSLFNNYRDKVINESFSTNPNINKDLHNEFIRNIYQNKELYDYIQRTGGMELIEKNSYLNTENAKSFNETFNQKLGNSFNQKPANIRKFVDEVQGMNDTITRTGVKLFKTSSADTEKTGYAQGTLEEKSIFSQRLAQPWRNSKFETVGQGKVGGEIEPFNKDDIDTFLLSQFEELKNSNQLQNNISFEDYKKKQLDAAYQGVRLDVGKQGVSIVAQYKLGNFEFEHDTTLNRDDMIQYFGVPAIYFSLGQELKQGLALNQAMYADFGESNGIPPVRLYQAQSDIGISADDKTVIDKGMYYILSNTKNLADDPNAGSLEYHPDNKSLYKHAFNSYDDFFNQIMDNPQQKMNLMVIKEMLSYKKLLEDGYAVDKIFEPSNPISKLNREQALEEVGKIISKISGKGNFNSAGSPSEYTAAGTVTVNNDGRHVIDSNVLNSMSNDEKIKLGVTYNPNLANQNWVQHDDKEHYLANPSELVPIESTNLTSTLTNNSKMKFQPDVANFVLNTDKLIKSVRDLASSGDLKRKISQSNKSNTPINIGGVMMNPEDLKSFEYLSDSDMLVITSGLRSLQDNVHAYRNNLKDLTVSPHMNGESIDIRTEPIYKIDPKTGKYLLDENGNKVIDDIKDRHYKAGLALWKFLATPSGKAFLKANNMNALYHDAGTGYHIDLTKATKSRPAGESKVI